MEMFTLILFGEMRNVHLSQQKRVVRIAQKYKKKIHILHVTTKQEIDFFSEKRDNVTFEITPQHLTIYAPDCYDKLKTFSQMNPPIRSKDHYDKLWDAVDKSLVSTIGSDHAPHTKEEKIENILYHHLECQECKLYFLLCLIM